MSSLPVYLIADLQSAQLALHSQDSLWAPLSLPVRGLSNSRIYGLKDWVFSAKN